MLDFIQYKRQDCSFAAEKLYSLFPIPLRAFLKLSFRYALRWPIKLLSLNGIGLSTESLANHFIFYGLNNRFCDVSKDF